MCALGALLGFNLFLVDSTDTEWQETNCLSLTVCVGGGYSC